MTATTETRVKYKPRGVCLDLWRETAVETLIEGPAGTGKTRGVLEYMHGIAIKYPKSKQLIARKTQTALAGAALATYRDKVAGEELRTGAIEHFGGSGAEPPGFRYSNGSTIQYRGLDDIDKTLSTEYDNVYVNEATECTEDDWELLTRCLRNGVTPRQRLIGDCNPSTDRHWLLRRCNTGKTRRLRSTVRDNPLYWDDLANDYTPEGKAYIEDIVGNMTGTRRQRLFEGQWVGLESAIYGQLDPSIHLQPLPIRVEWVDGAIGVDFGKTPGHPSTVVAITKAGDGVVWVRECWAETGGNAKAIEDAARGMMLRYNIRKGGTDPIQDVLAQNLGLVAAKMGKGTRKQRIAKITSLLDAKPTSLLFDIDGRGVRDTFNEGMDYRWEVRETDTNIEAEPVRKDDDRIASLEYAYDAMTTQVNVTGPTVGTMQWSAPTAQRERRFALPPRQTTRDGARM